MKPSKSKCNAHYQILIIMCQLLWKQAAAAMTELLSMESSRPELLNSIYDNSYTANTMTLGVNIL